MPDFHLVLLIHAHQPVGNFEHVLESAYQHSYLPFVETLARHPRVRMGLHFTGPLLEWIEKHHPEYFEQLREMVRRGQVEIIGGGFYEPILPVIPFEDRIEQIHRLADYVEKLFGQRPKGAWLAERVWEPQLPTTLERAAVKYTLVDDTHFIAAGFEAGQLYGHYIAEDLGAKVSLLPGLKDLRYHIPFRSVEDTLAFLRSAAEAHPGGFAAMGDDCEKFGMWPETYDQCYTNGWLEQFFAALEQNAHWLGTQTPSEAIATHPSLGRADLPTASYPEMMEWALPTPARAQFEELQKEFGSRPDVTRFLRGGMWRAFFSKYSESNLLHKKMLYVSSKLARLGVKVPSEARTHLLRAQCNDAYWHGIFGGAYAPHLRTELWRELIRAEVLAENTLGKPQAEMAVERLDFDTDGHEEIYATSAHAAVLVKPSDGGTVAALDFRPSAVTLVNSMQRRVEAYHARLHALASQGLGTAGGANGPVSSGPVSIHDHVRMKEPRLERLLRYDRWARNAFRVLVFGREKTLEDYRELRLEEDAGAAAGMYEAAGASAGEIVLQWKGRELRVMKRYFLREGATGAELQCVTVLEWNGNASLDAQVGVEVILNLLAPDEPDRRIEFADAKHPLRWSGIVPGGTVRLVDEWQDVAVTIDAAGARETWIVPVETVSESEEGFERVYQGSQILPLWSVTLSPGAAWEATVTLSIRKAR